MRSRLWLAVLTALALQGCHRLRPTTADARARAFLDLVHAGDTAGAARALEGIDTIPNAAAILGFAHVFFQHIDVRSAELVAWNVSFSAPKRRTDLSYEVKGDSSWVLVGVQVVGSGDSSRVAGFHWQLANMSLHQAYDFRLRGKSAGAIAFLCLGTLLAVFHIIVAVAAWRARQRWWWVVLAFVGFGHVAVNWATGATSFDWLAVHVLSFGSVRDGFAGPWTIYVAIPLGALIVVARLVALKRMASRAPGPVAV